MTEIRHECDFLQHLELDPKERWNCLRLHPFSVRLEEAYQYADVTPEERVAWQSEVRSDFVALNFTGLPINEITHDYAKVKVDARSLVQCINNVAQSQQHCSQMLYSMNNHVTTLVTSVGLLTKTVQQMGEKIALLEARQTDTPSPGQQVQYSLCCSPPSFIIDWTTVKGQLEKAKDPKDKFVGWHLQQGEESFKVYKASQDGTLPRAMTKYCNNMKQFSDTMLLLADSIVEVRPLSDPNELFAWEEKI